MRVRVYKERDGVKEVLVLPGRRAHLSPILLRAVTKEALMAEVAQTVRAVHAAETGQRPPSLPA